LKAGIIKLHIIKEELKPKGFGSFLTRKGGRDMNNNQVSPHEILELHELLNANILGAKKLSASVSMVKDEALKTTMQNTLNGKKAKIQELENFINSQLGGQLNAQNSNQGNNQSSNQSGQQ
jgi:hypothetical protein